MKKPHPAASVKENMTKTGILLAIVLGLGSGAAMAGDLNTADRKSVV